MHQVGQSAMNVIYIYIYVCRKFRLHINDLTNYRRSSLISFNNSKKQRYDSCEKFRKSVSETTFSLELDE